MSKDDHAFASLVWGVKDSLVSYLRSLHDGEIAVQEPATVATRAQSACLGCTEAFAFAPDRPGSHYDSATRTGQLQFRGAVVFSGHFNTMRVELIDPRLDLVDGTGTLSVRTNGRIGMPRWESIATAEILSASGAEQPGITLDLALTSAGRLLLGQQYPVGQALAPATVEHLQRFP